MVSPCLESPAPCILTLTKKVDIPLSELYNSNSFTFNIVISEETRNCKFLTFRRILQISESLSSPPPPPHNLLQGNKIIFSPQAIHLILWYYAEEEAHFLIL